MSLALKPNPRTVVVCNPSTARVSQIVSALERMGENAPKLISYEEIIDGSIDLAEWIGEGSVVKLEAPGKHFPTELKLLSLGMADAEREGSFFVSQKTIEQLATESERAEIIAPRQWYHGWRRLLDRIAVQLSVAPSHLIMNDPLEVGIMFDKPTCHRALESRKLPVPRCFGVVRNYSELQELIGKHKCRRLFLKIANGSSASGVVAYQADGRGRHLATTTVELCESGINEGLRLYNSRRIRAYDDERTIARLVDALGGHLLHVEEWLPKARLFGKSFDLRILVVDGKVTHSVARLSTSPLTNLHLLNERMDGAEIRKLIPEAAWTSIAESCQRAMAEVFPHSLYAGFDVLLDRKLNRHAIAEVNAFGDHLNGILYEGRSTHEVEFSAAFNKSRTELVNSRTELADLCSTRSAI